MPKLRKDGSGSLSKTERKKLQRLYSHVSGTDGSVRNLVKASNLPVSKVRQFLHSKPSYTKFTLTTSKFKRMKAFARFKYENWCINLAYVDNLAENKNGVKYILFCQDLFDRTLHAKGKKAKDSTETVNAFFKMILEKNRHRPKKTWVDRETELAGGFKKFSKVEGIQV